MITECSGGNYGIYLVAFWSDLYSTEYHVACNQVCAHKYTCFENIHHITTIQLNTPSINKNTLHMVKFIKTISFACETHSLIAVLTHYTGFHAFSTTTLTSSPPGRETIYSTLHPKWAWRSWYLSAAGIGGVLGYLPGTQWEQGRLCGGSWPSDFVKTRIDEELWIVDGLQAYRRSDAIERLKSTCSTVLSLFPGRSP
jgi:hypothetical protein